MTLILAGALALAGTLGVSAYTLGHSAFKAGMGVKRWVAAGLLLGPAAMLLFNAHRQLAYRKTTRPGDSKHSF
ncbi:MULTISPECIES: hypothetical protein [Shewanella]|uniref:hypothetical protein n=1 Tax=Shewanella TaxID=22 RepID=UPI0004B4E2E1|nr:MULTISPECIES: hypothetical protein [Shewanella]BCV32163.1 hypothetical protein TUM4442_16900 [Shewanella algae]BCV66311.1 hypothetical protein TUM17387_16700 [Shewanella carassii]